MEKSTWTYEWPTKPGLYWFYGWITGYHFLHIEDEPLPAELDLVEVGIDSTGSLFYVTDGRFVFKEEDGYGKWQLAVLPDLPVLEIKE